MACAQAGIPEITATGLCNSNRGGWTTVHSTWRHRYRQGQFRLRHCGPGMHCPLLLQRIVNCHYAGKAERFLKFC